jgi:hypothetical protein
LHPDAHERPLKILVSGMIAAVPGQGGATWAVLQYVLGLRRLGHDVVFVEQIPERALRPDGATLRDSRNAAYLRAVAARFDLNGRTALLLEGTTRTAGMTYDDLRRYAEHGDVLLNLSGLLTDPQLMLPPARVYVDLDPAFTQLWAAVQHVDMRFHGHTHFVTVGCAIGSAECSVPTCGVDWIPTLQPVVLDYWTHGGPVGVDAFTSIGHWRGYGSIACDGVYYGQKAHSLRNHFALPQRSGERFVMAFAIHPDETADLQALAQHGWELTDPARVASSPRTYQHFVRSSRAEFGIAKSGYVLSRCGWFSDRSICYLASGRPVLAQDTGFASVLPVGQGLLAFTTDDDALAGLAELRRDYAGHARAARDIAEQYFDSDRVLGRLLEKVAA